MMWKWLLLLIPAVLVGGYVAFVYQPPPLEEQIADDDALYGRPFVSETVAVGDITGIRIVDMPRLEGERRIVDAVRRDGAWVLDNKNGYPVSGERAEKTIAAIRLLERGAVRGRNASAHGELALDDPTAPDAEPARTGKLVELRDASGAVVTSLIIGTNVPEAQRHYYVRKSDEDLYYSVAIDSRDIDGHLLDMSARFEDWIDTDLLGIERADDIRQLSISNYRLPLVRNALGVQAGELEQRWEMTLSRPDPVRDWRVAGDEQSRELDQPVVRGILRALDTLAVGDVIARDDASYLEKGFYYLPVQGAQTARYQALGGHFIQQAQERSFLFLGSHGGLRAATADGLVYVLLFGQPVADGDAQEGHDGRRHLLVHVAYDPEYDLGLQEWSAARERPAEAEAALGDDPPEVVVDRGPDSVEAFHERGQHRAAELQERYARFFYVVNDVSYDRLLPERDALYKDE